MTGKKFSAYKLDEYPRVRAVKFPDRIHIAFAVCAKSCGNKEFIVDGSSQVCQYCGKLMYRTKVKGYEVVEGE